MNTFDTVLVTLGALIGSILGLRLGWLAAVRYNLFSRRKLGRKRPHIAKKVPVIGGFSLTGGVVLGLALGLPVGSNDILLSAGEITAQLQATLAAVVILWLGGLVVDQLRRRATAFLLASHAAAVILLLAAGVRMRGLTLWGWELPVAISVAVTAVWLFLMIQFSRFLDGIDGLLPAAALALTLGQLRIVWGHTEPFAFTLGVVSLAVFAVLLVANFYPARVYLGNNGAAIPGLLLGMLAIAARTKSFLTTSALIPLVILVPTLGYIGLRILERTVLSMRLPRWQRNDHRTR